MQMSRCKEYLSVRIITHGRTEGKGKEMLDEIRFGGRICTKCVNRVCRDRRSTIKGASNTIAFHPFLSTVPNVSLSIDRTAQDGA